MNSAAVPGDPSRRIAALGAAVVAVYLFFADPYAPSGLLPACIFHSWTGLYCPGCGSTRAFYELLHGHLVAALRLNAFTLLTVPPIVAFLLLPKSVTKRWPVTWRWVVAYAFAAAIFAVLRNIPHYPFTLLAP